MYGNGHAVLEFGQCLVWSETGFVKVTLDENEIGSTTAVLQNAPSTQSISFQYHNGSKLEIREVKTAIMELTKFAITSCGRYFFMHQIQTFYWTYIG